MPRLDKGLGFNGVRVGVWHVGLLRATNMPYLRVTQNVFISECIFILFLKLSCIKFRRISAFTALKFAANG